MKDLPAIHSDREVEGGEDCDDSQRIGNYHHIEYVYRKCHVAGIPSRMVWPGLSEATTLPFIIRDSPTA